MIWFREFWKWPCLITTQMGSLWPGAEISWYAGQRMATTSRGPGEAKSLPLPSQTRGSGKFPSKRLRPQKPRVLWFNELRIEPTPLAHSSKLSDLEPRKYDHSPLMQWQDSQVAGYRIWRQQAFGIVWYTDPDIHADLWTKVFWDPLEPSRLGEIHRAQGFQEQRHRMQWKTEPNNLSGDKTQIWWRCLQRGIQTGCRL